MTHFWVIIYTPRELHFHEKNPEIPLTQFWVTIHITREFNFCKNLQIQFLKKINIWVAQFRGIIYTPREFNFYEKDQKLD